MRAAVLTVSDGVASGSREDTSGAVLAERAASAGFEVVERRTVADERDQIAGALEQLAGLAELVLTTGGTGFAPRDVTPEATRAVLDREAPGLAEALRLFNRDKVPTTILSRAVAGVAGSTIVVNLPGSTSGVRDGVAVLAPVIGHAVVQLRGGDH